MLSLHEVDAAVPLATIINMTAGMIITLQSDMLQDFYNDFDLWLPPGNAEPMTG